MVQIKDVVLNTTGHHAIVVDANNEQWFCHYERPANVPVQDYLMDVFLYFLNAREEYFYCDAA